MVGPLLAYLLGYLFSWVFHLEVHSTRLSLAVRPAPACPSLWGQHPPVPHCRANTEDWATMLPSFFTIRSLFFPSPLISALWEALCNCATILCLKTFLPTFRIYGWFLLNLHFATMFVKRWLFPNSTPLSPWIIGAQLYYKKELSFLPVYYLSDLFIIYLLTSWTHGFLFIQ